MFGETHPETQFWDLIGRVQNQIGEGLQSLEQRQLGDRSKALVTGQPLLTEGTPEGMRDILVPKDRATACLSPRPCSSTTPMAPRLSRLA